MQTTTITAMLIAAALFACDSSSSSGGSAASASASATPPPASASASAAPSAAPPPSATASAAPRSDCPKGSTGPGTFDKPCDGKGTTTRLMDATWIGKSDDKGPQFRVTNKATLTVLYGKIAVYFYDKSGKQLDVKGDSPTGTKPFQTCSGNIFAGVLKPNEKAVMSFSCVKKDVVPDGTDKMEAEVTMVGFADATEKKNDFYWKNDDLSPDVRKKGGVK